MKVGEYLRGLREQAGMSQAEVAEKLGSSQPSVAKLEARSDILISTFAKYVEAIGEPPPLHSTSSGGRRNTK